MKREMVQLSFSEDLSNREMLQTINYTGYALKFLNVIACFVITLGSCLPIRSCCAVIPFGEWSSVTAAVVRQLTQPITSTHTVNFILPVSEREASTTPQPPSGHQQFASVRKTNKLEFP